MVTHIVLPRLIWTGAGQSQEVARMLDDMGIRRILLVHGRNTERAGLVEPVRQALSGRIAATFAESASPTTTATQEAVTGAVREAEVQGVVAVGGGSAIDAGKVAVHASHADARLPLIAIPTTLSGAEMTLDCGIVDLETRTKRVLRGHFLVASGVIADSELLATMSDDVTAGSAMNALAHCVEALYTPATSAMIQAMALAGAALLVKGGRIYFSDEHRGEARGQLSRGAVMAGIACGNASIALHHVMCHYVGPQLGIPHGTANAIMLPHVMRFNLPAAHDAFSQLAQALGVGPDPTAAIAAVEDLQSSLGLPRRLGPLGLNAAIVDTISGHVVKNERLANNPRPVTRADVEAILWAAA